MSYVTDSFDDEVVELLKSGDVGFMPSDTIYGLSCQALNESAVERLHRIKGRDKNKPFVVLISEIKMFDLLGVSYNKVITTVEKYWPGPLSVIFPAPKAPVWLHRGTKTLAIRSPDNKDLRDLINKVGPLISTSANPKDRPPASSVAEAKKYFGDKLDFYVDTGKRKAIASTIVRAENGKLVVIRKGAIEINDT